MPDRLINALIQRYCQLLQWLMAACLLLMLLMVFGNVVLRYGFNSGIAISEEASRWLFVWMTFMGAVVALRERGHLGTDILISRLPKLGKKICLGLSYCIMLFLCGVLFKGAWEQVNINVTAKSAAMEANMAIFFSVGLMFAVLGGLILLRDLLLLITGRMSEAQLTAASESEDSIHTADGNRKP